jgi:hypothetical protein
MDSITIVVPTYGKKIENNNTLPDLLVSLKRLKDKNFRVIVLNDTVDPVYHKKIKTKINEIIEPYNEYFKITQISYKDLRKLHRYFNFNGFKLLAEEINFKNYSGFRNLGLIISHLIKSDIVVFLDDDEVVEDKLFLKKAQEFVGKKYNGKLIGGITGYYINRDGAYTYPTKKFGDSWWDFFWRKDKYMNDSFKIIGNKKRLNETNFALGGNMVLHRKMFEVVPFDTFIERGEDIDLLINAKFLGYEFLLDNKLGVRHYPTINTHAEHWAELRKDSYRFLYQRRKLSELIKDGKFDEGILDFLCPYPGHFLKDRIYLKLILTDILLYFDAIIRLRFKDSFQHLKNIKITLVDVNKYANENARSYYGLQKVWVKMMSKIKKDRELVKYFNDKFNE